MRNIEPAIQRQRLIIEARYTIDVDREVVKKYLLDLVKFMGMNLHPEHPEPLITSATGHSNPIHDGYEGFCFWLESGTAIYIWEKLKFLSVDIYSCKNFETKKALDFTKNFFQTTETEFQEIAFK